MRSCRWLRTLPLRLRSLLRPQAADRDLDDELRYHLDLKTEENIARGMTPHEAQRQARISLGGVEQVKEQIRADRADAWLGTLLQDVRFGLRMLRKNPGFTVVAVLTLALGIGATTVMFSAVYGIVLNPLPYKNVRRWAVPSVQGLTNVGGWKGRDWFSLPEYKAFQQQNHVFEDIIGSESVSVLYDDAKSARVFQAAYVTPNVFEFYGIAPLLGRGFSPQDATAGASPTFVMSYGLWRGEFDGDPKILGTAFSLNGKVRTLIGIAPREFNAYGADIWLPECLRASAECDADATGTLHLIGRLKPRVTLRSAAADLNAIAHHLPNGSWGQTNPEKFAVVVHDFRDSLLGNFKKTLYALLAAVLLLLLIACSNVANLLLARATAREREMAMRASMGATRRRLIGQLLVEASLLVAAASAIGCGLAYGGVKILLALIPTGTIPKETTISMSAPVLLFSLGVTIFVVALCGLAPAFHAVSGDLQAKLKGGGGEMGQSPRRCRLRAALVIAEVALSIILLIGSGLLIRSFFAMTRVDLGFNPRNMLYIRPWFPKGQYESKDRQNAFTRQLLERMATLPGVTSVAESMLLPPLTYDWSDTVILGKPHAERWETRYEICSEGYFQTLGIPLLQGRLFSAADVAAGRYVMVVNQAFARQYLRDQNPLGQRVKLQVLDRGFLDAPHDTYFEVIGVVANYKTRGNNEWQTWPQAFIPYSEQGFSWRTFIARTSVDPQSLLKSVNQAVWAIDPDVGIRDSGSIEDSLREFYRGPEFQLATLAAFASIGLILVAIGIFSVMAYTVSLRTRELGIRIALGAQQADVVRMVLKKGFLLVATGAIFGVCAGLALTQFFASFIGGVSPTDFWSFCSPVAVIVTTGLAACYIPARRAMRVDPMVALRHE